MHKLYRMAWLLAVAVAIGVLVLMSMCLLVLVLEGSLLIAEPNTQLAVAEFLGVIATVIVLCLGLGYQLGQVKSDHA